MIGYLAPQAIGAVAKWESRFWISTFPRPTRSEVLPGLKLVRGRRNRRSGGNVEISRRLRDSKGSWETRPSLPLAWPRLPQPIISTALRKS